MEQLVARWAHNPKVVGSSPAPATQKPVFNRLFYFHTPISLHISVLLIPQLLRVITLTKSNKDELLRFSRAETHPAQIGNNMPGMWISERRNDAGRRLQLFL